LYAKVFIRRNGEGGKEEMVLRGRCHFVQPNSRNIGFNPWQVLLLSEHTFKLKFSRQEFIKYLFGYFDPPEAEKSTKQPAPKVERAAKTVEELIPVYSSDGKLNDHVKFSMPLNNSRASIKIYRAGAC
jgi:hypothetical protein